MVEDGLPGLQAAGPRGSAALHAAGRVEDDGVGKAKVFLKIIGTTDVYTISYDKDAVKKKIAGDLKKEVQELKDAFKLKGIKKKKELELTDEEFDWENQD